MNEQFTLKALVKSFGYAIEGIVFTVKSQRNMRLHLLAAVIVCSVAFWLNVSREDWRWLALCMALVWITELLNSAVEYLCDVVMPDQHLSVKRAKDIAAGAVLIGAVVAAVIGGLTLWPYLW
jgi:diacylglycerol kinase (ATP)